VLDVILARLLADPEAPSERGIAFVLDKRLAEGQSDGWRYDAFPPVGDAARLGLRGVGKTVQILFGTDFFSLSAARQEAVLGAVQAGSPPGEVWQTLPAARFFKELPAEVLEAFYSHPLAQEEIGYIGMADAHGWTRIRLNEREGWESVRG
jgi:gluconate 2-dehydrogenase gamma chain